jgi:hypothetical protein
MTNIDDRLDYIDQVFDRTKNLVRTGIWGDIKEQRLEAWLGCLRNFNAELLGAYLLDNLCFRSKDQFNSLLDALFLDLPDQSSDPATDKHLMEQLRQKPCSPDKLCVCLAPVIGSLSPPTKSGPYILRLAQRRYGIHPDWLVWAHKIQPSGSLTDVIFVDDFCGSGKQFTDFCEDIKLSTLHDTHPNLRVTYLVAAAHKNGIKKIQEELPFVQIKCAERLGESNAVLSDACFSRYQIDGFQQLVMQQYQRVIHEAGLPKRGKLANGFGDLGLAYGFAHSTPNNTLPIFWLFR